MQKEQMNYDVVVVGAGAAGLSAAIRIKQLAAERGGDISVCVLEKGSEVGAHILSGALIDPRALNELFPNWQELGAPLNTPVSSDHLYLLSKHHYLPLPPPPQMNNHGNFVISLGSLCRWLAKQAEELGVEIYPGFAAAEILYDDSGAVKGVASGDMGLKSDGTPGDDYQSGMELLAKQTIFAEGCRGSLTQEIIEHFKLSQDRDPQLYGIGIKELWEIEADKHKLGQTIHTVGWPLNQTTYGGAFVYHLENNQVAVGFVIGLDYKNPYLSPFDEFQRFKTHPLIRKIFEGGRRIAYGARALAEGGIQSLPKLTFSGGVLVGDAAGFLNVPRIKGIHGAIKSGGLAAEAVYEIIANKDEQIKEASSYAITFKNSWLHDELWRARNIRPAFRFGLFPAFAYSAIDTFILRGRAPWTMHHRKADNLSLNTIYQCRRIEYHKPDSKLTFDRLSSVYLAGVQHREGQPSHLTLKDERIPIKVNLAKYDAPESRYCPAQVYEIIYENNQPALQINAQNCIHCKTCDIKDPTQNIIWKTPEGGSGPNYPNM